MQLEVVQGNNWLASISSSQMLNQIEQNGLNEKRFLKLTKMYLRHIMWSWRWGCHVTRSVKSFLFWLTSMVLLLHHGKRWYIQATCYTLWHVFWRVNNYWLRDMWWHQQSFIIHKMKAKYSNNFGDASLFIIIIYEWTNANLNVSSTPRLMLTIVVFDQQSCHLVNFCHNIGFVPKLTYGKIYESWQGPIIKTSKPMQLLRTFQIPSWCSWEW